MPGQRAVERIHLGETLIEIRQRTHFLAHRIPFRPRPLDHSRITHRVDGRLYTPRGALVEKGRQDLGPLLIVQWKSIGQMRDVINILAPIAVADYLLKERTKLFGDQVGQRVGSERSAAGPEA